MGQHIVSHQPGGEIKFDSFFGFYGINEGDAAPKLSGHVAADDASKSSEHVAYKSTWDPGTDKLKQPTSDAVRRSRALLQRFGCGTLLLEVFAGAFILTMLAGAAGWPCCRPLDILHDGLDLRRESDRKQVDGIID